MTTPIVELRQYTLYPGRRDGLIELFDREFVESQEALGVTVIGQFRDLDDPNRFVWLRGFPSLEARPEMLTPFYAGPAWQTHRNAANATIVDSDNVLQLRPFGRAGGFDLSGAQRGDDPGETLVVATIHYLTEAEAAHFAAFFETDMRPAIGAAGAPVLAAFATDPRPNNFPGLPLREDERVFVWFTRFDDADAHDTWRAALPDWRAKVPPERFAPFMRKPEILRLSPTPGSLLR